jgi:hypothetical protein
MKRALILFSVSCFLLVIAILPLPIPPYLDFQVIYHADMGLLRGIQVYDHAGQVEMIAQVANVQPGQVYLLPFPYPPWVALATLPLALLPITIAARLWFGLNLLMLFASIWLLTDGWGARKRLASFVVAVIFWPVLGSLFVGQYVFPVLLGAALWGYAARKEHAALTAVASALLTFKPHLGALILLAGIFYLWRRGGDFGRRALIYTLLANSLLFVLGFLADRAWPLDYLHSLSIFRQDSGVASCRLCASLPVALVRLFNGQSSLAPAPWLGSIILVLLVFWLGLSRRALLKDPNAIIAASILATLLSSPYLLNYDFVLLLLPLFLLAGGDHTPLEWSPIVAAYLIPFVALEIWNRNGNIVFLISAFALLILFDHETRQLDGLPRAA